jgi:hypothetical protein
MAKCQLIFITFLMMTLAIIGCNQKEAPLKRAVTPEKLKQVRDFSRPLRGFETLRLGMSKEEALSHLPWGLTEKDLPLTFNPENIKIHFIYGEEISPNKWDVLKEYKFAKDVKLQLVLGFSDDVLSVILIALPKKAVTQRVMDSLVGFVRKEYGPGLELFRSGEWVLRRLEGSITIINPKEASEDLVAMSVATDKGDGLLTDVMLQKSNQRK